MWIAADVQSHGKPSKQYALEAHTADQGPDDHEVDMPEHLARKPRYPQPASWMPFSDPGGDFHNPPPPQYPFTHSSSAECM